MKRFLVFVVSSAALSALLPHVGLGSTTKNDQMVVAVSNAVDARHLDIGQARSPLADWRQS